MFCWSSIVHIECILAPVIRSKVQTAAVVAAVVAILAVRNRDRVGLLTFGEDDPLSGAHQGATTCDPRGWRYSRPDRSVIQRRVT